MAFTSGKHAFRYCDRCDFRYPYNEVKPQVVAGIVTSLYVCESCMDVDNQQYRVGQGFVAEPQALRDPRPDKSAADSRGFARWNPVLGLQMKVCLGRVTAA